MNNEHNDLILTTSRIAPPRGGSSPSTDFDRTVDEQERTGLWRLLNDRLQGRWTYALLVGAVLAAAAAPAGYFFTKPKFESRGLIRVAPKLEHVIHETQETELMPFYTQFVQTQAQLVGSDWVLQQALRDESMRQVEWSSREDAVEILRAGLSVEAPRSSQLVIVSFESTSGAESEACLNAVLRAFNEVAAMAGGSSVAAKLDTLQRRRTALNLQFHEKRKELQALPSVLKFATADLEALLRLKVEQQERYNQELDALRVSLAVMPVPVPDVEFALPTGAELSSAQLDRLDPTLLTLRERVESLRFEFEQIRQRFAPASRSYRQAEQAYDSANQMLVTREDEVRRQFDASGGVIPSADGDNDMLSPKQLLAKQKTLQQIRDALSSDIQLINIDNTRAVEIRTQMDEIERGLAEVDARITDLQVETESADRARVAVFQWGVRPASATRDRRGAFAMVGAMSGFSLSIAFFFVLGSVDRRAYQVDQLSDEGGVRCLGVLPDLGRGLDDPEAAEMAAHCVHQIRNLVDAGRDSDSHMVLCCSSPFQGDGKTSITVALGFSYAAAGYRTCVVDGDLVGRGLTRQLGLVGMEGLKESLRDRTTNDLVLSMGDREGRANLFAIPVGVDASIRSETVRRHDLAMVFEELRSQFEVVLVDTGPVLGSLECIPIAAASDAVILTVRRGRQRERLQECVDYLTSVGARCAGVVLNCAARRDCHRYISEQSLAPPRGDVDPGPKDSAPVPKRNLLVAAMREQPASRDAA